MAERKEALGVILKSPALQTLRIQFCFSSANGWQLVLLTVDDSFQRNCCASRAYLEGNEGFLAYFSSNTLALSLCDIINPLMGVWYSLLSSWLPLSHLVHMATSRNRHVFHQDKEWSQKSGDWVSMASSYAGWGTHCKIDVFEHLAFVNFTLIKCRGCFCSPHATGKSNLSMNVWGPCGVRRTMTLLPEQLREGRTISSLEWVPGFDVPYLGG